MNNPTIITINRGEAFSTVSGEIVPTADANRIVNLALKEGRAVLKFESDHTLRYEVHAEPVRDSQEFPPIQHI